MNITYFDFNDADDLEPDISPQEIPNPDELKAGLLDRLESTLNYLLPDGKVRGNKYIVGNIDGDKGKSLTIELNGPKAGVWHDFASNESGDIFDLWAYKKGLSVRSDFPKLLESVAEWLGNPSSSVQTRKKSPPRDELGPYSAKWDYTDKQGNLIACVYRYDLPDGKEFRPWDVKARKQQTPAIRPLYNQPLIAQSSHVILVEGEKCADALVNVGSCATTAMNGANAPIDKTDWSPLENRHVLLWPDNDEAGKAYVEKAAHAVIAAGARSVTILSIPNDKPAKWDAYDAIHEGLDINEFIKHATKQEIKNSNELDSFSADSLMEDKSTIPDDLISPRILTPSGLLVLGGAPKAGKSDFLLNWLMRLAAGEEFLGMKPSRRLRIFYLQCELEYHYLRERMHNMNIPKTTMWRGGQNLHITSHFKMLLDDKGINVAAKHILKLSEKEPFDIIVIDPLRNVFYGGEQGGSENDNQAMLFFLQMQIERLRDMINPKAGIMIVHHTKKMQAKQFFEDPFFSFSGASSLRGYYTSGMLLYRPEETKEERILKFELRNGAPIQDKHVSKRKNQWYEMHPESARTVNQAHGEKLDAERRRKQDAILQLIYDEAAKGHAYTIAQFAEAFEGKAGLGGSRTIQDRLTVLSTKGYIKFFREYDKYDLPKLSRSKFGYMCVEGMKILTNREHLTESTGELMNIVIPVKPSLYKCPQSGAPMPVENPNIWVYQDEELQNENPLHSET